METNETKIQALDKKDNREKGFNNYESGAMLVVVVIAIYLLAAFLRVTG